MSLSGSSRVPYLLVLWEGTVLSPLYPQGPAQVPPSAVSMTERKHDQRHLNLLFCFNRFTTFKEIKAYPFYKKPDGKILNSSSLTYHEGDFKGISLSGAGCAL